MKKFIVILYTFTLFFLTSINLLAADINTEKNELEKLENSLLEESAKLNDLNNQIIIKNEEIIELQNNLKSIIAEKEKQYDFMKLRIKYLYENNNFNYLDMICNSKSFSDILANTSYINEIINYDRNQLQKYINLEKELEKIKSESEKNTEKLKIEIKKKKNLINKLSLNTQSQISSSISYEYCTTYTTTNNYGYSDQELDLICAIVAQECSSDYEGSLAVITCALNRCASSQWSYLGSDPLSQLCASGQFTYSIDGLYKQRLNGNYSDFVKEAVLDALSGKRNHNYLSFRSYPNPCSVNIGGNWYFNAL